MITAERDGYHEKAKVISRSMVISSASKQKHFKGVTFDRLSPPKLKSELTAFTSINGYAALAPSVRAVDLQVAVRAELRSCF